MMPEPIGGPVYSKSQLHGFLIHASFHVVKSYASRMEPHTYQGFTYSPEHAASQILRNAAQRFARYKGEPTSKWRDKVVSHKMAAPKVVLL
jgi:hypothetical protein